MITDEQKAYRAMLEANYALADDIDLLVSEALALCYRLEKRIEENTCRKEDYFLIRARLESCANLLQDAFSSLNYEMRELGMIED